MSPLKGFSALVTSGPTYEPIDPVRFLGNRSSGKQGHAIAQALHDAGARVTLITGPTSLPDPRVYTVVHVTTAEEMLAASERALPVSVAVFAAAVADWRVSKPSAHKLKKTEFQGITTLQLIENPDILAHISHLKDHRPELVIGFAAETEQVLDRATEKRKRKGCDYIIANQVGDDMAFGRDENAVMLIGASGYETWPLMSKQLIAEKITRHIIQHLRGNHP